MSSDDDNRILLEPEAAKYTGNSCRTLQRQRSEGSGPPYVRIGRRRIGYVKRQLDEYLASRTYSSRAAELAST